MSGTGSDADQTRLIPRELSILFDDFDISTMLDIPCGDFHWMKSVDLHNIEYMGADIVKELVQKNTHAYARRGIRFEHLDLIKDELPSVDLVFCRDCLVHLSFADVFLALENICNSGSQYLLTTTFTERSANDDIVTGQWRTLNLEIAPFMLPPPIKTIIEDCTEDEGAYGDKALGLWKISDVRTKLSERSN